MKKRVFSLLLVGVMLAGTLSGCGEKGGAGGDNSISVSVFDRGTIPASEGTYEENRWTKWMNEQSGINVNWVPIPRNESAQKINMLAAAGEAPDLIVEYNISLFTSLIQQGILMPIDEYIEQYAPNYKAYLEANPELNDFVKFDGKTYLVTSKRSPETIVNHGAWIRQDWLDKLGLEMPTTDEELMNVARAFRDGDPDGNGINDTISFSVMNWHETFPQMYQAGSMWYDEGGTLKFGHTLDRYGEAYQFMKTAYDEGMIDKEFITDKDSTRQKQLWITGKSGIYIGSWSSALNKELLQNNMDANPVPLKPVSTKYGLNAFYKEAEPYLYVGFNKNMKNPEAALKFIDWMITDGWFNIKFGEEGVHYNLVDGVPQTIDEEKKKNEVAYAADYAVVSQWQMQPDWFPVMAAKDALSQRLAQQNEESLKVNQEVPFRRDIPVDPQLPEVVSVLNEFQPLRDDIRMKMIVGGPEYSVEKGMEEIRKEWERIGGAKAEQLMNEWYQNNK